MEKPFLKKYQPRKYNEFIIDSNLIKLLRILIQNDSLNLLLIGNIGSGKSSLLDATIREYYDLEDIPTENIMYINNLQEQGIQYYRNEVKSFCQTKSTISGKKKFIVLDDIDLINVLGYFNEPYSQQKEIKYLKKEIINLNKRNKEMDGEMNSGTFKEDQKQPHY